VSTLVIDVSNEPSAFICSVKKFRVKQSLPLKMTAISCFETSENVCQHTQLPSHGSWNFADTAEELFQSFNPLNTELNPICQ